MFPHIYHAKFIELSKNGTNILVTENVNGAKNKKKLMLAILDENMDLK